MYQHSAGRCAVRSHVRRATRPCFAVRIIPDPAVGDYTVNLIGSEDHDRAPTRTDAISMARALYGNNCVITERGH